MYPFLNCSNINSYTSSLSFLNNGYIFLFLSMNSFFISIVWFYSFLVGIYSLAFFPKTLIHLWKCSDTNLLATASDFTISSSLSQIFHSSASLFTSIIFSFLGFFFSFFSFLYFLSSCLFPFFLPPFASASLTFSALVSIASHIPLDTLLFLLLLSSN